MNPYDDYHKLGWEMIYQDNGECYEYDCCVFWKTKDGQILHGTSSGCSCSSPFDGCEGKTEAEIIHQLERVGSLEQAHAIIDAWNDGEIELKREIRAWFPPVKAKLEKGEG